MFERIFSRRSLAACLTCLLAVAMLGAGRSSTPEARYGRIGHNLMCVCSCGQVLLECNHVGCPDSARMIGELHDQVGGGGSSGPSNGGTGTLGTTNASAASDAAILNWFAAKYGATVLAAPIRGGFDNLAWILPSVIFVLAIFGTAFMVRMWAHRRALAPAGNLRTPTIDAASSSVRDRIRRETEWQ